MAAISMVPLAKRALASDTVDYAIVSRPIAFEPSPGVTFGALAYNGMLPGPLLRVTYGQRIRVRYRNRSGIQTTIHWHGMILPNAMDGVPNVTQPPVESGASFLYEFAPGPPGTRWYHDHGNDLGLLRGLFGMFIVDDPNEEPADRECVVVLHDVANMSSVRAALAGKSEAPVDDLPGSPESAPPSMQSMSGMSGMNMAQPMGDEVAYRARCIDGRSYPHTRAIEVRVGERVRLRVLNANPTQTKYLRLAGNRLTVTHSDGNPLVRPVEVDALRIGVAERYDAWFEAARPGAWLLQTISGDASTQREQAVKFYTPGMEAAAAEESPQSLEGVNYLTYEKLAGVGMRSATPLVTVRKSLLLGGGGYGKPWWTIDGERWPNTPKIRVRRGDRVAVHFKNKTSMDHPMHLHGHRFDVVEVNGSTLASPLNKDVALVPANGGTLTWEFDADSPAGRWLLHCHNEIHMTRGMVTEVDYIS
jgi:FtsP/CotA-like multicopper oxidase with cupredoxin domain